VSKDKNKEVIPRALLKQKGVRVKTKGGKYVFNIPADLATKLIEEYAFSFDQLKVGGDIPLAELAIHIDEQASLEANVGQACELMKHQLELLRLKYEEWYESKSWKARVWNKKNSKHAFTEGALKSYLYAKYGKQITEKKRELQELETSYRLINNVIRQAIIVKGTLLPTLRNIVQGRGDGVGSITVKVNKDTREKLKTRVKV
jgi:hypothetical protein